VPNISQEIWQKMNDTVGETTPEGILDYIYAILHSPNYREKYKELLKIDFPRVPFPENRKVFFELGKLGKELRDLHLLKSLKVADYITTFSIAGDDIVEKGMLDHKDGNAYINATQYFGNVPQAVWELYIGGYQPAQRWLKERHGRILTDDDIDHYQKMIVSMNETIKIMTKIDTVLT
jgi:predicted helicase